MIPMRFLLAIAALFGTCALAQEEEDQPYTIQHRCDGADVVIKVEISKPGTLIFRVPHTLCGTDT